MTSEKTIPTYGVKVTFPNADGSAQITTDFYFIDEGERAEFIHSVLGRGYTVQEEWAAYATLHTRDTAIARIEQEAELGEGFFMAGEIDPSTTPQTDQLATLPQSP